MCLVFKLLLNSLGIVKTKHLVGAIEQLYLLYKKNETIDSEISK